LVHGDADREHDQGQRVGEDGCAHRDDGGRQALRAESGDDRRPEERVR
jgi:hypothetical protein